MGSACSMLRPEPHYRADAVARGLSALGFKMESVPKPSPTEDDVLVIWNRYGQFAQHAQRYESSGARVVVLENGYMGREWKGCIWYAAALSRHNGGGEWGVGNAERARALFEDQLHPWTEIQNGEQLMLMQRGIGSPPVAQPPAWKDAAYQQLRAAGFNRIRVRNHPGKNAAKTEPLEMQLVRAEFAVTWASGAAIKALLLGIPVFYGFSKWIGALAARPISDLKQGPFKGDRWPMLERLAWAMWDLREIESGEAFDHLLR